MTKKGNFHIIRHGFFGLLTIFLVGPNLQAAERILNFHSNISINQDSSMVVIETIRVQAEGNQIKRGIYRDFPTDYQDKMGNRFKVGFKVLEITRDGMPEDHHTESLANGVRVYIGNKNYFLKPGEYTYTITYRTTRQLGFFDDHDELYWNVTGNGWSFPIDSASADVTLPSVVPEDAIKLTAYTGPLGATDQNFTADVDNSGVAHFQTTNALGSKEGLTIVVGWPKGYVNEPTPQEKFFSLLNDNRKTMMAFYGLVGVFIYYLLIWVLVGKDPAPGTIIPLFAAPPDLSPAAIRYISQMGYDEKTAGAAFLSLAVKGWMTINDEGGKTVLTANYKGGDTLTPDEKALFSKLFDGTTDTLMLSRTQHARIRAGLDEFRKVLKTRYDRHYFMTNLKYFLVGIILSLIAPFMITLNSSLDENAPLLFMVVWLTGWTIGVYALLRNVGSAWKSAFRRESGGAVGKAGRYAGAIFISLFSLPFIGGEILGIWFLSKALPGSAIAVLILTAVLHIVFYHLLKAPTMKGRWVMDKIEGFKMYLSAAESDRLKGVALPPKSTQLFEKYLPYALALGVESNWAQQFASVIAAASAGPGKTPYRPIWYTGHVWNGNEPSRFCSDLGSSLSSTIASSSTPPGSSSGFSGGGGGGSSGGGGGGGGGGGW